MFLLKERFDLSMVDVFVADSVEAAKYRKVLGPDISIVIGVPGINRQREFIQRYYPADVWILSVDDDIRGLKSIYPDTRISELVPDMIRIAEREGSGMIGVYPNDHGLCLQDRIIKGFIFVIGSFYLFRNDFRYLSYPDPTTEDFTRCALYWMSRRPLLRFEGLGVCTSYAKEAGGLSSVRAEEGRQLAEMHRLVERFPDLYKIREREGKPTDVTVAIRAREIIRPAFGKFPSA